MSDLHGMRYLSRVPRELKKGRVLVHNHILPQPFRLPDGTDYFEIGMAGFRAWTQRRDRNLMWCQCDFAGVDLHGMRHYRIKRKGQEKFLNKLRQGWRKRRQEARQLPKATR